MILYQDDAYRVELREEGRVLAFVWEQDHPEVTLESFIESCGNFIGYGFEYVTKKLLIDTRNFQYLPPPEFYEWQRTRHHNRYRKIGIEKVAYIMESEYVEEVKKTAPPTQGFITDYFDSSSEATNWLLN